MREGLKLLSSLILLLLASCGGGGPLDTDIEGELDSVMVYASPETTTVQGDLLKRVDFNGDNVCDTVLLSSTPVNLRVKVVPKPFLPETVVPSPVEVEKVQLVYQPKTTGAYPLNQTENMVAETVEPDTEVTFPVNIVSEGQADAIVNSGLPLPMEYYVVMYVTVRELYSGRRETITTGVNLSVGDFITEEENCTIQ